MENLFGGSILWIQQGMIRAMLDTKHLTLEAGLMNREILIKHLEDVKRRFCKIGRAQHGSFGISAMDLKKVLDQTVRELRREVNKKVLKVPEIEIKVCEATSNEPWGPHGTIMGDIAQATRNFQEYHMIMGVLWKRLHDSGKNWRHVYKSLTVMEYLIANGAERVVDELREQGYQIQALFNFQYIEPNGKDQGINVRKKARSLVSLMNDRGKIRELRQKAAANRDKYRGLSSTGVTFKPSSYLSTSGSYGDKDDDGYGGGSSMSPYKDDERLGQERDCCKEECWSQRESISRDSSCGDRDYNKGCGLSRGGDRFSDKCSTEGDRERGYDIDDCRQYSRGIVAAVARAQSSLSQPSTGPTSQLPPRTSGRELFLTIKSPIAEYLDDFDPRGTSSPSVRVAASKVAREAGLTQSPKALEDFFADVEFQVSLPPISAHTVSEQEFLNATTTYDQAPKPNPLPRQPPPPSNITNDEFQPFIQAYPQAHDRSLPDGRLFNFNPSFATSKTLACEVNGKNQPIGNTSKLNLEGLHKSAGGLGSPTESIGQVDLLSSFNPFFNTDVTAGIEGQQQVKPQPQTSPFLSPGSSSTFWDDLLITNLVDLNIGRDSRKSGQKQEKNGSLGTSTIGIQMVSPPADSRASYLPPSSTAFATTLNMGTNELECRTREVSK